MSNKNEVNPNHYRNSDGVQLIEIVRCMPFSIGNSVKYIFRHENKNSPKGDLEKALWYLDDYLRHPFSFETDLNLVEQSEIVLKGSSGFVIDTCAPLIAAYQHYSTTGDYSNLSHEYKMVTNLIKNKIEEL